MGKDESIFLPQGPGKIIKMTNNEIVVQMDRGDVITVPIVRIRTDDYLKAS